MKDWKAPQSHAFGEIIKALRNALAMLGLLVCVLLAAGVFAR